MSATFVIGTDPGSATVLLNPNLSYERTSIGLVTLRALYFSRSPDVEVPVEHQGLFLDNYVVEERGFYFVTATYTGVLSAEDEREQEESLVDGGLRIVDDGEGNLTLSNTLIRRTVDRTRGVSLSPQGGASQANQTVSWVQRGNVYHWERAETSSEIVTV